MVKNPEGGGVGMGAFIQKKGRKVL